MTIFIIAYIIFLIIYAGFSVAILYHLVRFGYKESASKLMLYIYPIFALGIIILTFVLIAAFGFDSNLIF